MYRATMIELNQITPQIHQYLLDRVANGDKMRDIATEEGYTLAALLAYLSAPERRQSLLDARAIAAGNLVEDTISIADRGADTSAPDPARDKLRIQTRQWLASRWDRNTYSDRSGTSVEVNVANMYLNAMRNVQPVDNAVVIEHKSEPEAEPEA